jgi:hypothetical protein
MIDGKDNKTLKLYRDFRSHIIMKKVIMKLADYFLKKSRNYTEISQKTVKIDTGRLNNEEIKDLELDKNFIKQLPVSYDTATTKNLENVTKMIDFEIDKLVKQRDILLKKHA